MVRKSFGVIERVRSQEARPAGSGFFCRVGLDELSRPVVQAVVGFGDELLSPSDCMQDHGAVGLYVPPLGVQVVAEVLCAACERGG